MIRLLVRLVLVLVLIAALLIGMTCCAARAVFGSCASVCGGGPSHVVLLTEAALRLLRPLAELAVRVKLNLCMVTV